MISVLSKIIVIIIFSIFMRPHDVFIFILFYILSDALYMMSCVANINIKTHKNWHLKLHPNGKNTENPAEILKISAVYRTNKILLQTLRVQLLYYLNDTYRQF